jgi:hypothetical protein
MNNIERIVGLLMDAASGGLDPDAALQAWPNDIDQEDAILAEARHTLSHFSNDWDIRQKDRSYDELMRAQLFRYAREIKARFGF